MKPATILLSALLAGLSMGAVAQNDATGAGAGAGATTGGMGGAQTQTFTELDTNNDGTLDEQEIEEANTSAEFDSVDQDGDGEVDRNEYYQHQRDQQ